MGRGSEHLAARETGPEATAQVEPGRKALARKGAKIAKKNAKFAYIMALPGLMRRR
jgi:hypothetical protein